MYACISSNESGVRETTYYNALTQLFQLRQRQSIVQFGLTDQHNLNQLLVFRFQIRQHPNLLEQIRFKRLRLINNQHNIRALTVLAEQKLFS